jgi:hypothetical protein
MAAPFRIFIGWDQREPETFDVAEFSLTRRASIPVSVTPSERLVCWANAGELTRGGEP